SSAQSLSYFNQLPDHRQNVHNLSLEDLQIEQYYTHLIKSRISDISRISDLTEENGVRREVNAFIDVINMKESLGLIRTNVFRSLVSNEFHPADLSLMAANMGAYEIYRQSLIAVAPPQIFDYYNQAIANDTVYQSFQAIDRLMSTGSLEKLDLSAEQWFSTVSFTMNSLMNIQSHSISYIRNTLDASRESREAVIFTYLSILAAVLILVILFSIYIIRMISLPLQNIKAAADKISLGDTNVSIQAESKDEIGDLARSFKALANNTLQLSRVADAIGSGNYDVHVEIRSQKDLLGMSLLKMKENLKNLSVKEKDKTWLLTGSGQFNDLVRGEKDLGKLSTKIINHFCSYLQIQIGAIYILDDYDKLRLSATYGFNIDQVTSNVFDLGEGLAGQAAYDKEIKYIENIPDNYWQVKSGLIEGKPHSIIVYPLLHENQVLGAFELANMEELSELQLNYMDHHMDRIGMVISNVKADLKTAELLYQTQNQAEEMEAQQEELRQINDELKEQSMRLQASEEELKANQEELQEKNAELEEKANQLEEQYESINGKNKELEELKEALQLKVEQLQVTGKYKSEFLANMSHELRTPLNSILILARILSENKNQNLNEKQVEFCEIIQKSGKELLSLINEILDLAKIESGKVALELSDIKLSSLISETQYRELAKENDITFKLAISKDVPEEIHTDAFRLEQVLKNLLSNAFKFTNEGGQIALNIFNAPKTKKYFNPELVQTEEIIAFEVKDTGIGIPEEKQKLIFEAFQQADTSTSRKYGGTGLGLSISKELANLLGGEIQLESTPGEGSIFTLYVPSKLTSYKAPEKDISEAQVPIKKKETQHFITIPKNAEPSPVRESPIGNSEFKASDRVILVIEDDENYAGIIKNLAKEKGFKTLLAHTGEEGYDLAKRYKPDAILLDINLPKMSGVEVKKKLDSHQELKNIPVHIMSGEDKDSITKHLGNINFLQKPVSIEQLQNVFQQIASIKKEPLQKILIIEDNAVQNLSIKELLNSRDIPSESVFSGKEAMEKLNKETYDCVILDINLPDISGFDLLQKAKDLERLKETPFIIYSGRDLTRQEEKILKKYSSAIIVKTANSYKRLLDEIGLFLHSVEGQLPKEKEKQFKLLKPQELLSGKKVLIVDDDIRNIYALYNVLESQEMEIITAGDGKEALEVLEKNPDTHIILMDIMMPEMDGYEATRRIRQNHKTKNIPVIAITAKAMKGDKEKCIDAGASDYISKPVDIDKLLSLMKVWLYESARKIL
ncbi:MAG: response regulator, partial [Cytophagaceae bacterium]